MSDKAETEKAKRKREVKDAGERTVLMGIQLGGWSIVRELASAAGLKVKNMEEALRDKGLKAHIDRMGLDAEDGVTIWVKVGQVKADTREEAIDALLGSDLSGSFRAPNASAWRGQINRKPPEQVSLEVEVVD
jgi:hypothetical protein